MKTSILVAASLILAVTGLTAVASNPSVVLSPERAGHTGTMLDDGKVLIAGGISEASDLNNALLYDWTTNTITATGSLVEARENHTATKLLNGTVLITGGELLTGQNLNSAEIYDPATGLFRLTVHGMSISRTKHTATLLWDGTVLIVGGKNADLFDPATETFTNLLSLPQNRSSHSAVLLADGTVLITGGYTGGQSSGTAEIFDPTTQTFGVVPSLMRIPRANHDTTLLFDGRVLVTGGFTGTSPQDEVDLYDPVGRVFAPGRHMIEHRSNHRNVLLPDGTVLVVGGTTLESGFLADNEVYDPISGQWTAAGVVMNENRSGASANILSNATVFVAGGISGSVTLQTAEILDPGTRQFTKLPDLTIGRNQHSATLLPDGRVLLAGGSLDAIFLDSSEIFDPANDSFTASGSMSLARKSHTATLLGDDNRVLIAGGKSALGDTVVAEIYDISLGTFRRVADMSTGRSLHTATLLHSGLVLEAAGRHGATPTGAAELFDPATELFSDTGSLNLQRKRHDATLMPDGTVFVSGGAVITNGEPVDSGTPTCEIYDPITGTWAYTIEEMNYGRTEHQNTLLSDGRIIITGGILLPNGADLYDSPTQMFTEVGSLLEQRVRHVAIRLTNPVWGDLLNKVLLIGGASIHSGAFGGLEQALASVELYDPDTGQFSLFGNMTEPRQNQSATLLNDGRIMIAGGVSSPAFSGTGEVLPTGVSPTPTPSPTPTLTPTPTPTPIPMPATLGNLSTRANVGTGDNVLIGGFIVTGTVPKKVILRALGPSLSFPSALADPTMTLYDSSSAILDVNDNWQDGDKQAILESRIPPSNWRESAIVRTLDPGSYTAIVRGVNNTTGVALVEAYDLDPAATSKLANISTRGLVQTDNFVMIGGMIILGDSAKVIVRAIGPSLPVPGALQDPTLELHDGDGNIMASNDDWRTDQEAEIIASNVQPPTDAESAIVATLMPGGYTAIVRGVNGTTGVALVETYQLTN